MYTLVTTSETSKFCLPFQEAERLMDLLATKHLEEFTIFSLSGEQLANCCLVCEALSVNQDATRQVCIINTFITKEFAALEDAVRRFAYALRDESKTAVYLLENRQRRLAGLVKTNPQEGIAAEYDGFDLMWNLAQVQVPPNEIDLTRLFRSFN